MKLTSIQNQCSRQSVAGVAVLLVFAGLTLAGCMAAQPALRASDAEPCVTVNNIEKPDAEVAPNRKVILVSFLFLEGGIKPERSAVVFGRGPTPVSQGCNFLFQLVGTDGADLAQFGIWDPRIQISDDPSYRGLKVAKNATYVARFPFSTRAQEVRVLDSRRQQASSVEVVSAIRAFCLEHPNESDCQGYVK